MQDFLKDHGEWLAVIIGYLGAGVLLVFGLGRWSEKQKGYNLKTDKRLEVLEDLGSKCDTVIRIPDCDKYRKESSIARSETREASEKAFNDLKLMIVEMRKDNVDQHKIIADNFNDQHNIVINHLLDKSKNNTS